MIIAGTTFLICILSMLKFKNRRLNLCWIFILLTALSGLYLIYSPDRDEDLYRHYMIFDKVMNNESNLTYLGNIYLIQSPGYIILLKILSVFNNLKVLPFVGGIICYSLYLLLIDKELKEYNRHAWVSVFCYILMFINIRFIDISGIRNIMAATIFAVGVYYDLVEKKSFSFILYLLAASLHGIAVLYFMLRLLVVLFNKGSKVIICAILMMSAVTVSLLAPIFEQIFNGIPFISELFTKVLYYMKTGGMGISKKYRLLYIVMYLLITFLVYVVDKYFDKERRYEKLTNYIYISVSFTLGFIGQREMFNRARMLILPLMFIYLSVLLKNVAGKRILSISISCKRENALNIAQVSACAIWGIAFYSIFYFIMMTQMDYILYNSNFY